MGAGDVLAHTDPHITKCDGDDTDGNRTFHENRPLRTGARFDGLRERSGEVCLPGPRVRCDRDPEKYAEIDGECRGAHGKAFPGQEL